MGLQLSIDTSEIQKASDRLNNIKLKIEDIRGAGDGIRLILQQDVDDRFLAAPATETGGDVLGGEYWEALSEAYLDARPERRNGQILRDTGELQQSMTAAASPYGIWAIAEKELVFGTALAKSVYLQKKRPFLFWHPALLEKVANYVAGWLGS